LNTQIEDLQAIGPQPSSIALAQGETNEFASAGHCSFWVLGKNYDTSILQQENRWSMGPQKVTTNGL